MNTELVRLTAEDGVGLDAILYRPVSADTVVIHVHGKGGNFYTGPGRFIPELTTEAPLAHLSINMQCHDLAYTRYDLECFDLDAPERVAGGMWEDLARGHLDVEAAVTECRARGYERIVIAGHSSGGFYAGIYCARDPAVSGLVLLSPLTANGSAFSRWFAGGEAEHAAALEEARALVVQGHGHWLVPLQSWYFGISAQSLVQRDGEAPGVWPQAIAAFDGPLLMLWSQAETRDALWAQLYEEFPQPGKQAVRLSGGDHQYHGHEAAVATAVSAFAMSA